MDTLDLLVKLWPVVLAVVGLIAAAAVAFYRIQEFASFKKYLFKEDGSPIYVSIDVFDKTMVNRNQGVLDLRSQMIDVAQKGMKEADHDRICKIMRLEQETSLRKCLSEIEHRILDQVREAMEAQTATVIDLIKQYHGAKR